MYPNRVIPSNFLTSFQRIRNAEFLLLSISYIAFNEIVNNRKSTDPGPDGISYHILRQHSKQFKLVLINIFNRIMTSL